MNVDHPLRQRGSRVLALTTISGASLMMSMPVFAELSPALDRISISAGAFRTDPTFSALLNSPNSNLQSGDIGLGKKTLPRVRADIMIFDSQGLSFDYHQYKLSYTGSGADASAVNGSTATLVGDADFQLKLDFAKLAYKWWFGSGDTVFGLGAGAAYYKVGLKANATALIDGVPTDVDAGFSADAFAPLLELGVRHAISPDLRLFAEASGVKASGGRLKGEILKAAVGVEWFPIENVGVVLDYGTSRVDLSRDGANGVNFNVKLNGPSAFIKVRF